MRKTLLCLSLLFLLAGAAGGTKSVESAHEQNCAIRMICDSTAVIGERYLTSTIWMMKKWVEHCASCSTAEIVGRGWSFNLNGAVEYAYYDTVYHHKDPKDIPGMIEWIEQNFIRSSSIDAGFYIPVEDKNE